MMTISFGSNAMLKIMQTQNYQENVISMLLTMTLIFVPKQ